jgi:protein-tyrosine phosphatase
MLKHTPYTCRSDELSLYRLPFYASYFGSDNVCDAGFADGTLCPRGLLSDRILPFLSESTSNKSPVIVHCLAGVGRTGLILTAWLVRGRGWLLNRAIAEIEASGREPYEIVRWKKATKAQVDGLITGWE